MKKWLLKILKIFGISLSSIVGSFLVVSGVMYLVGALNPPDIALNSMSFEQKAYVIVGEQKTKKVKDGEEEKTVNVTVDSSIKLVPDPVDATQLDVSLSVDKNSIVVLPESAKVGKNIELELEQSNGVNRGGIFTLTATQEFLTTSTKVLVDSAINSITLNYSIDNTAIYPGTTFTVSLGDIPASYFRKPDASDIDYYYSVYGNDYFTKEIRYYSSNESVATVNEKTGEVTVLDEGTFKISAYIAKTYIDNANLPSRDSYLDDASYFTDLSTYCAVASFEFTSNSIKIGSITASSSTFNLDVFSNYKYATNGVYASTDNALNLNINILPPQNSSFSSDNLSYRMKDIEIYDGYYKDGAYYIREYAYEKNEGEIVEPATRISKYFKIQQTSLSPLYWTITPIDYSNLENLYLIIKISDSTTAELIDLGADQEVDI